MFEDSTFESGGRIKTKSKYWMMVTFIINGSILLLLILIPLIYPEALPKAAMADAAGCPAATATATATAASARGARCPCAVGDDEQSADRAHQDSAQTSRWWPRRKRRRPASAWPAWKAWAAASGVMGSVFGSGGTQGAGCGSQEGEHLGRRGGRHAASEDPADLSADRQGGARFRARWFCRPPSPRPGRSRIFASSADRPCCSRRRMDAVRSWRYRPYLLNNEPVEVETTVNVIFTLGG